MDVNAVLMAAIEKAGLDDCSGERLPANVWFLWKPLRAACVARAWHFDLCALAAQRLRLLRRAGIDTSGLFAAFLTAIGLDPQSEEWAAVMVEFEAAQLRFSDGKDGEK